MKKLIKKLLQKERNETLISAKEIKGLGSVNQIFEVKGTKETYIFRLNDEFAKRLEYRKEKWCLEKVRKLGIPSPKVLSMGFQDNMSYMIQEKIEGINGKRCTLEEKERIWKDLGHYAAKFHQISRIEVREIEENEFHADWKARLLYNIEELHNEDSLLKQGVLSRKEQQQIKTMLSTLKDVALQSGLVHGDLCPRNVIWNNGKTHLLDWGTAEINVVPHNEIGIVLMSKEASEREFSLFLEGLGISESGFKKIEKEINMLNLLHWLDKYRWAESYDLENLEEYGKKVSAMFFRIRNLSKSKKG